VIASFRCKDTEALFDQGKNGKFQAVAKQAIRKLQILHAAHVLGDLAASPGNRLEKLSGNRHGQHSIRINNQWRVCFVWKDGEARNVEILDYH